MSLFYVKMIINKKKTALYYLNETSCHKNTEPEKLPDFNNHENTTTRVSR